MQPLSSKVSGKLWILGNSFNEMMNSSLQVNRPQIELNSLLLRCYLLSSIIACVVLGLSTPSDLNHDAESGDKSM